MNDKERQMIMEFIRNKTSLKGDECSKVERFIIDLQYKRNEHIKQALKKVTDRGLKSQIRQIIKEDEQNGIYIDDIFQTLIDSGNKNLTYGEVEEQIRNILSDGEIYENKPNSLRWLE